MGQEVTSCSITVGAAAYTCEALPASGSVGAHYSTPVDELIAISPDGANSPLHHYGYAEPKLTTQQLHRWWHLRPREILTQQGIESQPGPTKQISSGCKTSSVDQLPFHIVSRNIRGVYKNLGNAIRTKADVVCLQEADIFESEVGDFCAQALVAGYVAHPPRCH